ncbi:MAG: CPBP family glutamic-type intramembrane protease [Acidobacteriota bacterium]
MKWSASPWFALPLFWIACIGAGFVYTQQKDVPWDVAQRLIPAFLLEATLFLAIGVERWRTRLDRLPHWAIALLMIPAAVAPYALASMPFHSFAWPSFWGIAGLAAILSFWYVLAPHNLFSDIGLLAIAAIVMLWRIDDAKIFAQFYIRPHPRLAVEVLGQAMWIRTGLLAILSVRRVEGVGFGFWPSKREWLLGLAHFAAFLPVAWGVSWLIGFAKPHPPASGWPTAIILTFFGTLWVLALGEELFFRGLLQRWMTQWLGNIWAGLIVTSLIFGSVHLWFNDFPNWRFALLAAVAGLFYGNAFRMANSIRASMVTHALTVTVWMTFFK